MKKSTNFNFATYLPWISVALAGILFLVGIWVVVGQIFTARLREHAVTESQIADWPATQPTVASDSANATASAPSSASVTIKPDKKNTPAAANISSVKYTLPVGWEAKITNGTLFLSPINDSGYITIKVFAIPDDMGRREFYCQQSQLCIEGTTSFTEVRIGNINGYIANNIDNSGGGKEYFGVKGNSFYMIERFTPVPTTDEIEKTFQQVQDSLIF